MTSTTVSVLTRPVVALDIDGVLNPDSPQPGYVEHQVTVPAADLPKSPFIRGYGDRDLNLTVRVNPDHGTWIRSLQDRADVVWATTWEHAANTHFAPLLGIDPLEVAVSVSTHQPRFGYVKDGNIAGWKAEALRARYPDRPFVWLDDMAYHYTGDEPWYGREHVATLALTPVPEVGITADHLARVEAFLAALT